MLGKLLGILIFFEIFLLASPTPLDDYVWAPDENYGWQYMVCSAAPRETMHNSTSHHSYTIISYYFFTFFIGATI